MLSTDDIVAIQMVMAHVHHIIDDRDHENLHLVYADDIVYDLSYRGLPPMHGIAEIQKHGAASYKRDFSHLIAHHNVNAYIYEDEQGVVRARSKVICIMADGTSTTADFRDIIVKTDKGWRIKERVASTRHPDAANWTKPEKA